MALIINSLDASFDNIRMLYSTIIIIIIIIIIMALQHYVGPWPLFQFLDPIHSRWDSLDGGSARRKNNTDIHALSGIRTHDPSVRAGEEGS
jgi:hypothetical protein